VMVCRGMSMYLENDDQLTSDDNRFPSFVGEAADKTEPKDAEVTKGNPSDA